MKKKKKKKKPATNKSAMGLGLATWVGESEVRKEMRKRE